MQKYYELVRQQQNKYAQPIGGQNKSNTKQNLLEDYADIMQNLNRLYASKYGAGNYDLSKGWGNQLRQPIQGWSDLQEQQALGSYGKYMTDLHNAEMGLNTYNTLMQNKAKGMAQADIIREQAEKYLPHQLRMQGMGGVGTSESSLIGTGNIYQRQIGGIESDTQGKMSDLLQSYAGARRDSDVSYAMQQQNTLKEYQDIMASRVSELLGATNNPEQMKEIVDTYKEKLSKGDVDYLNQYIDIVKKSLEEKKEEGFTDATPEEIKKLADIDLPETLKKYDAFMSKYPKTPTESNLKSYKYLGYEFDRSQVLASIEAKIAKAEKYKGNADVLYYLESLRQARREFLQIHPEPPKQRQQENGSDKLKKFAEKQQKKKVIEEWVKGVLENWHTQTRLGG